MDPNANLQEQLEITARILGPVSYAAVQALAVGETFDSHQPDDDEPPARYQGGPYFVTDADRPARRRQVRR